MAGVEIPSEMTGKSLSKLMRSSEEGFVDQKKRSYVLHSKERHLPGQEEGMGGYPVRAIRTHDYLYIRNFKEERWPSGTPNYKEATIPYCWLGDCDNGPTKSYMVDMRLKDEQHQKLYELAFGKRPAEELYDCRKDPVQLVNLAADPAYTEIKNRLSEKLLSQLLITADPRVVGGGEKFDEFPYLGHGPRHPSYKPE